MKKILGLLIGLAFGAMSYGQSGLTFTDVANADYDKTATTEFHFDFSSDYSQSAIEEAGAMYSDYFTVTTEPNGDGHTATVTLVSNDEMSRRVIGRFLYAATEQWKMNVNGDEVKILDAVDEHIVVND